MFVPWADSAYNTQQDTGGITTQKNTKQNTTPLGGGGNSMLSQTAQGGQQPPPSNKPNWFQQNFTGQNSMGNFGKSGPWFGALNDFLGGSLVNQPGGFSNPQNWANGLMGALNVGTLGLLGGSMAAPNAMLDAIGGAGLGSIPAQQVPNIGAQVANWLTSPGLYGGVPNAVKLGVPLTGALAYLNQAGQSNGQTATPSGADTGTGTGTTTAPTTPGTTIGQTDPSGYTWDGTAWVPTATYVAPTTLPAAGDTGGGDTGTDKYTPTGTPQIYTDPSSGQQYYWYVDNSTGAGYWVPFGTASGPNSSTGETNASNERIQEDINAGNLADIDAQRKATEEQQSQASYQTLMNSWLSNPYLYWQQLGQSTPQSVDSLMGGRAFGPGGYMSTPSAQWWNQLLPSQQQQVQGAVGDLGVNPADWLASYQRMIPGTPQGVPQWAR